MAVGVLMIAPAGLDERRFELGLGDAEQGRQLRLIEHGCGLATALALPVQALRINDFDGAAPILYVYTVLGT